MIGHFGMLVMLNVDTLLLNSPFISNALIHASFHEFAH